MKKARTKQLKKIIKEIRKIDWKSCSIGIILSVIVLMTLNLVVVSELNKSPLRRLQDAIDACPYFPSEYQENVFDCSNMANMLDDWLEQKYGYETHIVAWYPKNISKAGHAMVIANGIFIEPTTKTICSTFRTELYEGLSILVIIIDDAEHLPGYSIQEWGYPKKW